MQKCESASRRFQPGESTRRDFLHDCEKFNESSFQALFGTPAQGNDAETDTKQTRFVRTS